MKVKDTLIFRLGVVSGIIGLVMGTLGAHGIKFSSPELHKLYDTGTLYLFIHVPVLMILGMLGLRKEALLMMLGVYMFSIPLLIKGISGVSGGIIVPVGGMIMIVSWLWLLISGGNSEDKDSESIKNP